jgi:hypothetical protein
VRGDSLDARPLIRRMMGKSDSDSRKGTGSSNGTSLSVDARIGRLLGFNDEALGSVALTYRDAGSASGDLSVDAVTGSGAKLTVRNETSGGVRSVEVKSSDAGGLLRFLDVYDHAEGGSVKLSLSGMEDGPLTGNVVIRNFLVKNEPRLRSIVSTPSPSGDGRSLSEAVKRDIDVSTVRFERGAAEIEKGKNYLNLTNGVLRGPVIGTTFQGTVYDSNGDMDMTGTFMPAYGLNRLFAEIPIVGAILGNGRDRGLIGITYRLSGDAGKPKVEVNPVSLIAPGIFRSIFEYR